MTNRVRAGIGIIISGALGILSGVGMVAWTTTPPWIAVVITVVVAVAGALGFVVKQIQD